MDQAARAVMASAILGASVAVAGTVLAASRPVGFEVSAA